MKFIKNIFFVLVLFALFSSCETLNNTLSEAEIVEGLKSALTVGTDTSVTTVSKLNGYYGDNIIKILLPSDAEVIVDFISYIPGGEQMVEDVVVRLNRAAEDAAVKAKPIFWTAITSMTISDGVNILYGEDTAATHYLRENTYSQLFDTFKPDISNSLDKDLVGGVSASESWNSLTTSYNDNVVNTLVGQLYGLEPVTTDLSSYTTHKALSGLFVKIADEEKDIRHDPMARVNDILVSVFGQLDSK